MMRQIVYFQDVLDSKLDFVKVDPNGNVIENPTEWNWILTEEFSNNELLFYFEPFMKIK